MTEVGGYQPSPVDWPIDKGDVELAIDNGPRHIACSAPGQTKSDLRVDLSENRKERRQVHYAKRLNCPHMQLTA